MWNLPPSDRLRDWKEFRTQLSSLTLEEALTKTNHLWSYAPYVAHYLDPNLKEQFPDPWTLLHENYYCDLAKALGMLYTLYLCDHYSNSIKELELKIYKNPTNQDIFNTVWINEGKYILNLEFNTIVNNTLVDKNLILTHSFTIEDLQLNLY